ncbi:MAG: hypothetical protein JRG97_02240 [Deltaproteobacteria bacterium]|nr:hypothetical protein [Deltaproteobacteria bacterium]MBW2051580.1 hypothetical protein [Deltaproteobacteria bacterium]MBW2139875.1 hypothetical protein [Deltaproteobacteria bacterium]MBW2323204.1 hypothetical protein [Deltaproteobacteria bacterium]
MQKLISLGLIVILLVIGGCTGYTYRPVPFKAPEAYLNHKRLNGAVIAARAYSDKIEAQEAFGFDIRDAGLLPVQIIVDNKGSRSFELIPEQTLVRDVNNNMWNILPAQQAYERLNKKDQLARTGKTGVRSAALTGAAGAILGFALGVVTGQDIAATTAKGATAGAALGAVTGGAGAYQDGRAKNRIAQDLREKSLKGRTFRPKEITHGFIFFPGEIKNPKLLRLRLRDKATNRVHILEFSL